MNIIKYLSVIPLFLFLNSCYYKANLVSPLGVTSNIKMQSNIDKENVELITIIDSSLIIDYNYKLYKIPITNLKKIEIIKNIKIRNLKYSALGSLTLLNIAAIIYTRNYFKEENKYWKIPFTFFCLEIPLTIYFFGFKNPPVAFQHLPENLEKLKPYLRYPNELSNEQQKLLLRYYIQDNFLVFE